MRKVKEGAYSDKDLARAVNFFLMDKLRKGETLTKDQVIKIKNICYRLGRNKDPEIGALLAAAGSIGLVVAGEPLALPDDPEEHVKFEEKSEDQEGADDATSLEGLLADVTHNDLREMMMQKMGVDPVSNLSDYLQVQFSELPEGEQREMVKDFRGSAS